MRPKMLPPLRHAVLAGIVAVASTSIGCGEASSPVGTEPQLTPDIGQCLVTFGMVRGRDVRTLDFLIDYTELPGEFVRGHPFFRCDRVVDFASVEIGEPQGGWWGCDPQDSTIECRRRLTLTMLTDLGRSVDAPTDLARCLFDADPATVPTPDHFMFEDRTAADFEFGHTEPRPVLAATNIECLVEPPQSTSSTTSTTMSCAGGPCAEDEVCVDGQCVSTAFFEIEVSLADTIRLAALQFTVAYSGEAGSFVGERFDVSCTRNPRLDTIFAASHLVNPDTPGMPVPALSVAFASISGIDGPTWLVRCAFESMRRVPGVGTFRLDVIDASGLDESGRSPWPTPLADEPTIEISRVRPIDGVNERRASGRPSSRDRD